MKSEDSGRFDRALLEDALPALEPTAGFADRVVEGIDREPQTARRWPLGLAAVAGVAATVLVFLAFGRQPSLGGAGRVEAAERQQVDLGGRGIAVAEPGSAIDWRVARDGAAHVAQSQGNVFYRVERGEPFIVTTPAGEVVVKGTCFRVEVEPMSLKHALVGAAAGATLATVVVTVYEGRVAVRNAHGASDVAAGGKVGISAAGPPSAALAVAGDAKKAAQLAGAPADNATRDDLLTRDTVHRQQIAALEAQVKELARARVVTSGEKDPKGRGEKKFSNFTKDELLEMAKNCEIRADMPNFGEDEHFDPREAEKLGLSPQDMSAYSKVVKAEQERYAAALRGLFQEVMGDRGDNLELRTLLDELEGKLGRKDMTAARARVAQERAGLVAPLDPTQSPPGYRLLKLLTGEGDQFEQALAREMGPEKAHTMRENGSGSRMIMNGCER